MGSAARSAARGAFLSWPRWVGAGRWVPDETAHPSPQFRRAGSHRPAVSTDAGLFLWLFIRQARAGFYRPRPRATARGGAGKSRARRIERSDGAQERRRWAAPLPERETPSRRARERAQCTAVSCCEESGNAGGQRDARWCDALGSAAGDVRRTRDSAPPCRGFGLSMAVYSRCPGLAAGGFRVTSETGYPFDSGRPNL